MSQLNSKPSLFFLVIESSKGIIYQSHFTTDPELLKTEAHEFLMNHPNENFDLSIYEDRS